MPILFLASLPRTSVLGVADLLYRCIETDAKSIHMAGHIHLAAALSRKDFSQYHSPLHLYDAREALIRCLLDIHQIAPSIDSYQSIAQYYFSGSTSILDHKRFQDMLDQHQPLLIDPSFSHAIETSLIRHLPNLGVGCSLLILWANPIDFCIGLMDGVFGLDSCLQWMLHNPSLSFPLEPLSLWLEYIQAYLAIIKDPPVAIDQIIYLPRETISKSNPIALCDRLSVGCKPNARISSLQQTTWLFSECPFSGDPSYIFLGKNDSTALAVSKQQLARFSNNENLISEAMEIAEKIGYIPCP